MQQDGMLMLDGKPYKYVGINMWYAPMLASIGQNGDRQRFTEELDELESLGIKNIRMLAGADGRGDEAWRVSPCLQIAPGVYNDTLLDGLDYALYEMGRRGMKAVVFLNNAWDWSGGYVFYLENAGRGKAPNLNDDGYFNYINYASKFSVDKQAQAMFFEHLRFMLGRVNRYTGIRYVDDPTIMTWQIGNEPRAFDSAVYSQFGQWLAEASALIRDLDKNHLISIGSEGLWGCDGDEQLHRSICSDENIDYLTAHIWPVNWSWAKKDSLEENMPRTLVNTSAYIENHIALCKELKKPLVIEEFGFPRDNFSFDKTASTTQRDIFLNHIINAFLENQVISGLNIWTWGGNVTPVHVDWQKGDPIMGDPPQEQQGLYSVFSTDESTINIIKTTIDKLQ